MSPIEQAQYEGTALEFLALSFLVAACRDYMRRYALQVVTPLGRDQSWLAFKVICCALDL